MRTTTGINLAGKALVRGAAIIGGTITHSVSSFGAMAEDKGWAKRNASFRSHGLKGWAEGKSIVEGAINSTFQASESK